MAYSRSCRHLTCSDCGARVAALKVSAILGSPIINKAKTGIVGLSMGQQGAWLYSMPASELERFLDRWEARTKSRNPLLGVYNQEGKTPEKGVSEKAPAYVTFTPDARFSNRVVVLSTIRVTNRRKNAGKPKEMFIVGGDHLQRVVVGLTKWTYRGDGWLVSPSITGSITSSHNLPLDPDQVIKVAKPNSWVRSGQGVQGIKPIAVAAQAEKEGVQHSQHSQRSGTLKGLLVATRLTGHITPMERDRLLVRAASAQADLADTEGEAPEHHKWEAQEHQEVAAQKAQEGKTLAEPPASVASAEGIIKALWAIILDPNTSLYDAHQSIRYVLDEFPGLLDDHDPAHDPLRLVAVRQPWLVTFPDSQPCLTDL
jgi:hypothetical protein